MGDSKPDVIFLLAGQSNMAGRGPVDEAVPQDPKILQLTASGAWTVSILSALQPLIPGTDHRMFWHSRPFEVLRNQLISSQAPEAMS